LPSARVGPGEYALLVRGDYVASAVDVPAAPGTLLIRVPALGKGGLSNTGEALALLDPANGVLSRFPARPSEHPGVSLARRTPSAADEVTDSFGEHASPGASPGQPNTLAD